MRLCHNRGIVWNSRGKNWKKKNREKYS